MTPHGRPKGEHPRSAGAREAQYLILEGRRAAPGVHQ
jgi:hypothetical protein